MLKVTSQKIAQTAFQQVQAYQLQPAERWCSLCGAAITNIAYIDNQGLAGKGEGAVLCAEHATGANEATTAYNNEPNTDNNDMYLQV